MFVPALQGRGHQTFWNLGCTCGRQHMWARFLFLESNPKIRIQKVPELCAHRNRNVPKQWPQYYHVTRKIHYQNQSSTYTTPTKKPTWTPSHRKRTSGPASLHWLSSVCIGQHETRLVKPTQLLTKRYQQGNHRNSHSKEIEFSMKPNVTKTLPFTSNQYPLRK